MSGIVLFISRTDSNIADTEGGFAADENGEDQDSSMQDFDTQ